MAEFKAKMHQIQNRLDPTGGAYSAPPDPLAGFKGPTSKGGGGEGREGVGGAGEGEGQGDRVDCSMNLRGDRRP